MIFDLSKPLLDRAGRPLTDAHGPVTLATAIATALDTVTNDKEPLTGSEKMRRYRLASRILEAPSAAPLALEDAALCKAVVGDGYGPLIVGQIWSVLEPDTPA
jgi:hypothetical protein